MARRGFGVSTLTVVRPAGTRSAGAVGEVCDDPESVAVVEMYGPNQRSGRVSAPVLALAAAAQQRNRTAADLDAPGRRASRADGHRDRRPRCREHLDNGDGRRSTADGRCTRTLPRPARALDDCTDDQVSPPACGNRWASCTITRSRTATCAASEITIDEGTARFGGFGSAEYGATDEQLQADIAQLLVTTTELYGAEAAVGAAIDVFGKDAVLMASRRLTKSAMPARIRKSVADRRRRDVRRSRRGEAANRAPTRSSPRPITRFTRNQVDPVWCCSSRWSTLPTRSSAPCLRSSPN